MPWFKATMGNVWISDSNISDKKAIEFGLRQNFDALSTNTVIWNTPLAIGHLGMQDFCVKYGCSKELLWILCGRKHFPKPPTLNDGDWLPLLYLSGRRWCQSSFMALRLSTPSVTLWRGWFWWQPWALAKKETSHFFKPIFTFCLDLPNFKIL